MTVTTQSLLVVRQGLVPVERNAQPSTAGRRNERERERERERAPGQHRSIGSHSACANFEVKLALSGGST